jgi:DNA polymerase III subunit delta'
MSDLMKYQYDIFEELHRIIKADKIPNAFLFTGEDHSGRKEAAFLLAKGCNCLSNMDRPCNECRSCRKIDRQTHPDIIKIEPEEGKKIIPISGIRNISTILSSRPNEARHRMVLIDEAHTMNHQAQNALLKMLEEPPQSTFFVLIAKDGHGLLATIRSRCRKMRFGSINSGTIAERLIAEFNIEAEIAYIVSEIVGPDYEKSLICLNLKSDKNNNWLNKRHWLLQNLTQLMMTMNSPGFSSGTILLSQALSANPEFLEDGMAILRSFFRDLAIFSLYPEKIVNRDFFNSFSNIRSQLSMNQCLKYLELFFEAERKIEGNCSPKLTMEAFFLNITGNVEEIIYG